MRGPMHYRQPGEKPVPRQHDFARSVEQFPGPVAIARTSPAGTIALCGGEDADGHPWSLQVTYAATTRDVLRVRTVRGTLDWKPVIGTVENLATNLGVYGRQRELNAPEYPITMTVDGAEVPGTRIDLPDRSGVHLDWQGQHVYCTGDPHALDDLDLRTATSADFARFTAEFAEYVARRHRGELPD